MNIFDQTSPMKYILSLTLHCLLALCFCSCGLNETAIKPVHKDVVQAVYASGKIYPLHHVNIAVKGAGYVTEILVRAGDIVQAGAPLIILSSPNADVNINMAETSLTLSEQNNNDANNQLNAAQQDIQSAYTKYELDSTNYERYRNLWNENITTKLTVDQAKAQMELSYQNYKKAQSVYNNLKTKLSADVAMAKQQLAMQQNNKSDYILTAPFKGKVFDIPVREGQLLASGVLAIDFGEPGKFEAELDVDETDIGMIQLNQQILLTTDAYPGVPIYTTVREILPGVDQSTKTATVKANIPSDSLKLYSAMSAEANIIVSRKSNALVIPIDYLDADNTVTTKDRKKIPVKTGIRDMDYVEILSGIDENTELIKP